MGGSSVAGKPEPSSPESKSQPHFFKVIVHPLDQGLGLPDSFLQRYGHTLQKLATLKLPNGTQWEVELCYDNGGILIRNGLKEFGEFYSIEKNHFLVFRYEGKSQFHVIIFDSSALEINYPVRSIHHYDGDGEIDAPARRQVNCRNGSTSGEIAENMIKGKWIEVGDSAVQMLEGDCDEQIDKNENPDLGLSSGLINRRRRLRQRISGEGTSKFPLQSSRSYSKAVTKAAKIAVNRKATNPNYPSFSLSVVPSQIVHPHVVCVPINFAKENFGGDCKRKYKIRLPNSGKTWPVRLSVKGRRAHIHGTGWRSFAMENRLKVGEFCTFELVKKRRFFNFERRD
ncbi:OLC1v1010034C1 [Oldenlandia corymbosa var. corymbosa]|uniref:OLC1v1010034C1 n=1 Tax=Oldenlandia corymbosa var. corymbosa TaxID=529605 RepID=A0AAV1DQB2_OLDCO|nr:OLC1v1010034C1 [Oldenlandia corymbosa var. corymbosa]